MSDCPAYDRVCGLALTRMASGSDASVARIATDMRQSVPAVKEPRRQYLASRGERLQWLRELLCASPFDHMTFFNAIAGIEECAEKRFLMAVAAVRSSAGQSVPESAADDLAAALKADPGNAEYLQFAHILMPLLPDARLKQLIGDEEEFIRRMRARGVAEKGKWEDRGRWVIVD